MKFSADDVNLLTSRSYVFVFVGKYLFSYKCFKWRNDVHFLHIINVHTELISENIYALYRRLKAGKLLLNLIMSHLFSSQKLTTILTLWLREPNLVVPFPLRDVLYLFRIRNNLFYHIDIDFCIKPWWFVQKSEPEYTQAPHYRWTAPSSLREPEYTPAKSFIDISVSIAQYFIVEFLEGVWCRHLRLIELLIIYQNLRLNYVCFD